MRRFSSTFVSGLPGLGLLLLRLIAAVTLIMHGLQTHDSTSQQAITPQEIAAVGGLLLLVGLWTSIVGAIVAIAELWVVFSHGSDLWVSVMLVGISTALTLLGPGAWSVDARLYGWRRIKIRPPDK